MTEAVTPRCEVCLQGVLEAPSDLLVYKDSVLCEHCWKRAYAQNLPPTGAFIPGTAPVQRLPREIVECVGKLKEFQDLQLAPNECLKLAKTINAWFNLAKTENSNRPRLFAEQVAKSSLIRIDELRGRQDLDHWECVACGRSVSKLSKKCRCGYHELSLYDLNCTVHIYWKCVRCKFTLNILTQAKCAKCPFTNPDLAQEKDLKDTKCKPF